MGWRDLRPCKKARDLALAFLKTFAWPDIVVGVALGEALEKQFGGPIDVNALRPASVVIARSAYEDPSVDDPTNIQRSFGSKFIVRLAQRSIPAVSVAVSTFASDVEISADGGIAPPFSSNGAFSAYGNPQGAGLHRRHHRHPA